MKQVSKIWRAILMLSSLCVAFTSGELQEPIEDIVETFNAKLYFDLRLQPTSSNQLCNRQLESFQRSLDNNIKWARQMRDAWGHIPSGIFSGNLYDFGNFDQCINFEHYSEETGEILGQHCTLMIPYDRDQLNVRAKITTPNRSKENKFTMFFNLNLKLSSSQQKDIGIGICVPASCPPDDVKTIADDALMKLWNATTSTSYSQKSFCTIRRQFSQFSVIQITAM